MLAMLACGRADFWGTQHANPSAMGILRIRPVEVDCRQLPVCRGNRRGGSPLARRARAMSFLAVRSIGSRGVSINLDAVGVKRYFAHSLFPRVILRTMRAYLLYPCGFNTDARREFKPACFQEHTRRSFKAQTALMPKRPVVEFTPGAMVILSRALDAILRPMPRESVLGPKGSL